MSTESKRQRLDLSELHQLRWLLGGLLMLLSVSTAFYLDVGAEIPAAIALAAIVVALVRPSLPAKVPAWVHRLAFPVIVIFFVSDLWRTAQILPAMVRLDLLLLTYRALSYRQRRDDLQIVVLGLFLIMVAGVLTVSPAFAVQILAFTGCALGLLMVVTILSSIEGGAWAAATSPSWAHRLDWPALLRKVRSIYDWRLAALGALLFVGVVALSGFLFLAIPRFELGNSLFLERFVSKKARSGFNDTIGFRDVTDIQEDDSIALNVDVSDPAQAPASPYWRMLVLDDYHEGTFRLSASLRKATFSQEHTDIVIRSGRRSAVPAPLWTFYLESGVSRYLPLLGGFETIRFREPQNFRIADELGVVALRDEPATMIAYRVEGMTFAPGLPDTLFASRWNNPERIRRSVQTRINLSAQDRQILAAMRTQAVGSDPLSASDFSGKASAWLRKRHGYSLTSAIPGGPGDPLIRWMGSAEPGHCELFAGAFVLLARSAGFPSRIVTGFKGGTWNAYSNNFTIRNSDAHAWAEIWDSGQSLWLREDPLAVEADLARTTGEQALARRLDRSWSARFNSFRVFWYRRIVNFDQNSQMDTIKAAKIAAQSSGKWVQDRLSSVAAAIRSWMEKPWDVRRVGKLAAALAVLAAAGWGWKRAGLWRKISFGPRRRDPVRRQAAVWLARLDGPPDLVGELQRLRFGARETWPDPLPVFQRARKAARRRRVSR